MRFGGALCWVFVLLLSLASPSRAKAQTSEANSSDVLTPRVGHELFGTFQDANDKQVVYLLDSGSTVSLSWSQIKELQVRHKTTLRAKNLPTPVSASGLVELDSFTITSSEDNLKIQSPGQSFGISQADLVSIGSPSPAAAAAQEPSTVWMISVGAVASLITRSYVQQTWGGDINIDREQNADRADWRHQTTSLSLDALNSLTAEGPSTIRFQRYTGSLDHRVFLTKNVYLNVVAVGYSDSADNMYLEQDYGGGIGFYPFRNERQSLDLTADFLHIGEHFYGNTPSVSFAAAALQERYKVTLGEIKKQPILFSERFVYVPPLNRPNVSQLAAAATLSIPIAGPLSTEIKFKDDYIENAPIGKNWLESNVGITFTFPVPKQDK